MYKPIKIEKLKYLIQKIANEHNGGLQVHFSIMQKPEIDRINWELPRIID